MPRESSCAHLDREAEIVKACDQALRELGLVSAIEVVGAEVAIVDAVFEHVVGGREHRGGDGEDGFLRAPATLDPQELGPTVAVLFPGGCPRGLHESGRQPRITRPRPIREALAGALVEPGAEARPGDEMARAGKAGHIEGDLADELLTGPGEVPQLLDGLRGDEAAPDEAVGQQVGDPRGVIHVALAAGNVADVPGVGEDQLEVALEHMPDRLPVHPARLHGDVRTAVGREPVAEREHLGRRCTEGTYVVGDCFTGARARARDDRLLVHVQTGALGMKDVHRDLLGTMASAWSPRQRSLEGALSGPGPVAAVRGARGAPGPTTIRALRTNAGPTSVPTPCGESTSFHPPRVRAAGGQLQ